MIPGGEALGSGRDSVVDGNRAASESYRTGRKSSTDGLDSASGNRRPAGITACARERERSRPDLGEGEDAGPVVFQRSAKGCAGVQRTDTDGRGRVARVVLHLATSGNRSEADRAVANVDSDAISRAVVEDPGGGGVPALAELKLIALPLPAPLTVNVPPKLLLFPLRANVEANPLFATFRAAAPLMLPAQRRIVAGHVQSGRAGNHNVVGKSKLPSARSVPPFVVTVPVPKALLFPNCRVPASILFRP